MATLGVDKYARKGGRSTKGLPCRYASMQRYLRLSFNFGVNSLSLLSWHVAQGYKGLQREELEAPLCTWYEFCNERRGVIVISGYGVFDN